MKTELNVLNENGTQETMSKSFDLMKAVYEARNRPVCRAMKNCLEASAQQDLNDYCEYDPNVAIKFTIHGYSEEWETPEYMFYVGKFSKFSDAVRGVHKNVLRKDADGRYLWTNNQPRNESSYAIETDMYGELCEYMGEYADFQQEQDAHDFDRR